MMNMSISTISKGYIELEKKGIVEARERSGFFVRSDFRSPLPTTNTPTPSLEPRDVNRSALIRIVVDAGLRSDLVPFGCALTDDHLLPVKALGRIMAAVLRDDVGRAVSYETVQGNYELRKQIAFRSIDSGVSINPDQIIITSGCMEALYIALRALTRPGDNVLIQSPTYHCLLQLMENLGLRAIEIPTYPEKGIEISDVENAVKKYHIKACLLTLNFNNPDGSLTPEETKEKLVDLLTRRSIPLVEDDVYGDISFGPKRPPCCTKYDEKGMVLLCSSFSKTLAPGFRVGWMVPGKYYEKALEIKTTTSLSSASPTQMALAEYLKVGQYDRHLKRLRTAFEEQLRTMQYKVSQFFPPGTKTTRPAGGCVLWVELPIYVDSTELFFRAREQGISIAPGAVFSTQDKHSNFIRVNCGNIWSKRIEKGVRKLGELAASFSPY
jgi:DNA-binding transcriptional MocR family regulator